MREMDLIPVSYRQRMQIKRWLQITLMVLALILVGIGLGRFLLTSRLQHVHQRIAILQRDKTNYLQQQQTYNELVLRQNRLQKDMELLNGLRGGPSVGDILLVIDRVLDGKVWFKHWLFNRTGEVSEQRPEAVQSGYFIIIPQNTAGNGKPQTWKLDTHMTISGQAIDHVALSHFVTRLISQPEIKDVQVINTTLRRNPRFQVVDFELVVTIDNLIGGKGV